MAHSLSGRLAAVRALVLFTIIGSATVIACRDITRPNPINLRSKASRLLNPSGVVVVSPTNMHSWVFYDDQHDTLCTVATLCEMVSGPSTPPAGGGSGELTTPAASDGKALLLPDYAGTRFDQITALTYWTYRQTADAGNNLAISLQFNVDYDLTDTATAYQGRIVFEPYRDSVGGIPQNTWQAWNAKAGLWWGTHASVMKGGVATPNPCVLASPCTWTQLLAAFPDLGVHGTLAAVVLKAGSNWAGFRGDVDDLTISVNGVATTFDFELEAAKPHLHTELFEGVTGNVPVDSDYRSGDTVRYSFSATQGYTGLLVVVDDTLAAPSGAIVMDQAHTLIASADRVIAPNAQVQNYESALSGLLTAADPAGAYSDFLQSFLDRSVAIGSDSAAIELSLASYLAIDPIRDGPALVALDNALAGDLFEIDPFQGQLYVSYYVPGDYMPMPVSASRRPNGPITATSRARAKTGRHFVPAAVLDRAVRRPSPGSLRPSNDVALSGPPWPTETTEIIYINGINTIERSLDPINAASAAHTKFLLTNLLQGVPRFADLGGIIGVTYFYNRTFSVQYAALDSLNRLDPCGWKGFRGEGFIGRIRTLANFAACSTGIANAHLLYAALNNDYIESASGAVQVWTHLAPVLNEDSQKLAGVIWSYHSDSSKIGGPSHTILVTHSQGNIILAQALQLVPGIEGRPLQTQLCTADLSLASPIESSSFGLNQHFLRGYDINGDILQNLPIPLPNDFPHGDTDTSIYARTVENKLTADGAPGSGAVLAALKEYWGFKIHGVDYSYLRWAASKDTVVSMLSQLHDECTTGSLNVAPTFTMALGDSVPLNAIVLSRAGHPLVRQVQGGSPSSAIAESLNPYLYAVAATRPGIPDTVVVSAVDGGVATTTLLTVPRPPFGGTLVEKDTAWWGWVGGFNNSDTTETDPPPPGAPPAWDGNPSSCGDTLTTWGTKHEAWTKWAPGCSRVYLAQIPANALPVPAEAEAYGTDYSTGQSLAGRGGLIPVGNAAESLPVGSCVGPSYCVRAFIFETLGGGAFAATITSDTICVSDRCGGASNNRRPAQPRLRRPPSPRPTRGLDSAISPLARRDP